ncbi:MAG TPA: class I SAM-dependent methyltransferase [Gemmatimonadales bacterium]|jgi:SAM-dependent methyltransferase
MSAPQATLSANQATLTPADVQGRRAQDLFVLDRVKIQAWDRILFVQCGDGWIVEEAWRRAMRAYVCGLDTSDADIALATQLREVPGKVEFKTWDGQRLPVADRAFDRVVAILATPQTTAALIRDLSRVLRTDGDVYLVCLAAAEPDIRRALAQAGWLGVREVARSPDEVVVLGHAPDSQLPGAHPIQNSV